MALLLREELKTLVDHPQEPSVSIFAPMVQAGPDTRQNPVRIKNLLREAEQKLIDLGMRSTEARDFLDPAWDLLEDAGYWQRQADGLAVFRNPEVFKAFRLPLEVEEVVVVGSAFHIKPLLPLLTGDGRFYILAISENEAHLYAATRHSIAEVHVEDMPKNLAEVLRFDQLEKSLQFHSSGVVGTGAPGRGLFNGQGGPRDLEKEHIQRYFRGVDRALHDILRNERAPLVLAGVRYFLPIYQEVNSYPHLVPEIIEGNPERPHKGVNELHKEALSIVQPLLKKSQIESADLVRQAIGQGRGSKELEKVVPAAYHARVDRLFVPVGVEAWGSFNPASESVNLNPSRAPAAGEEDLLNVAAFQTYLKGGTVFAVNPAEMPVDANVAATFRF